MPQAQNVVVAQGEGGGGIYLAPLGTPLPAGPDDPIDLDYWAELGHIGEDGITESNPEETTDIRNRNGDVVRRVRNSQDHTYSFPFLETNPDTLEAYYGAGSYEDGVVKVSAQEGMRGSWIIHSLDGDKILRTVIPDGQVTERGDITMAPGSAVTYPVTLTCYPDQAGVKAYKYYVFEEISS